MAGRPRKKAKAARKKTRSVKRPSRKKAAPRHTIKRTTARRSTAAKRTAGPARKSAAKPSRGAARQAKLDRARRTLSEPVTIPSPPSSLNLNRRPSAARSGRKEMDDQAGQHRGMPPDIGGGDVDVDVEDAYFTGDEAPGGDNPTPDQDVVDDIGKALGVQYDDAEELKSGDKIGERDKHRWEMDPASSEDYKERK